MSLDEIFKGFVLSDIVKWIAIVIGVLIFVLFFALAPLHALILCGFLVVLSSMYFGLEPKLAFRGFILGALLIIIGVAGIYVPGVVSQLQVFAQRLKELMISV